MRRLHLRPVFRRRHSLLLAVAAVFVLAAGGIGAWSIAIAHRTPSLPPSSKPTQHLYPRDNGHVALLLTDQRIEFDFGDLADWQLRFTDASTGEESHEFVRLNPTTYAPKTTGGATVNLTRKRCTPASEPCAMSIQLIVFDPNNTLTSEPNGGFNTVNHP